MKLILTLFAAGTVSVCSFSQSTTNAGEYMNYFSEEYLQIQKDMWDYTRSVSHGRSARKVEKRRSELIQTTQNAHKRAQAAKPFKEDASYRDSVVRYFELIDIVLREDYEKIVNMEEVAEQSYDLMEAYMLAREIAGDKLEAASNMISEEHERFAETNNITLIESESKLGNKMEIANKVYDHYNEVYLIFFKSFKQEAYLLDAIGRQDVSAIEQNKNALLETVEEGREKLDAAKLYEGDKAMVIATKDLFDFYEKEANELGKKSLTLIEKSTEFNKVKEAFDQIKEKNRTQKDVDTYNKAVTEMNNAVNEYNAANEDANKNRSKLIDNWNKVAEKFTSSHVPRGK